MDPHYEAVDQTAVSLMQNNLLLCESLEHSKTVEIIKIGPKMRPGEGNSHLYLILPRTAIAISVCQSNPNF